MYAQQVPVRNSAVHGFCPLQAKQARKMAFTTLIQRVPLCLTEARCSSACRVDQSKLKKAESKQRRIRRVVVLI